MRARRLTSGEVGLMFVQIVVSGRKVLTLIDIGATHNFISKGMIKELGLKTEINISMIKAVNSQVRQVESISRNIRVCLGEYESRMDFVFEMDDFDLIVWTC